MVYGTTAQNTTQNRYNASRGNIMPMAHAKRMAASRGQQYAPGTYGQGVVNYGGSQYVNRPQVGPSSQFFSNQGGVGAPTPRGSNLNLDQMVGGALGASGLGNQGTPSGGPGWPQQGGPWQDFYGQTLDNSGQAAPDLMDLFSGFGGQGMGQGFGLTNVMQDRIPLDPVLSQRQIGQLMNDATGNNAALEQQGLVQGQQNFAARGLNPNSPSFQNLANRMNLNRMVADTQARRDIPIQAAQTNADHLIKALTGLATQRGLDIQGYTAQQNAMTGALTPLLQALVSFGA